VKVVKEPVVAPWLKSWPELETVNKYQAAENVVKVVSATSSGGFLVCYVSSGTLETVHSRIHS